MGQGRREFTLHLKDALDGQRLADQDERSQSVRRQIDLPSVQVGRQILDGFFGYTVQDDDGLLIGRF
jgi:hypothetical protein